MARLLDQVDDLQGHTCASVTGVSKTGLQCHWVLAHANSRSILQPASITYTEHVPLILQIPGSSAAFLADYLLYLTATKVFKMHATPTDGLERLNIQRTV